MTANGDIPESLEEINLKMNATTDEVSLIEIIKEHIMIRSQLTISLFTLLNSSQGSSIFND